jgi:hypothetical protein
MRVGLHEESLSSLSKFKRERPTSISSSNFPSRSLTKIRLVEKMLFHAGGRKDGRTDRHDEDSSH